MVSEITLSNPSEVLIGASSFHFSGEQSFLPASLGLVEFQPFPSTASLLKEREYEAIGGVMNVLGEGESIPVRTVARAYKEHEYPLFNIAAALQQEVGVYIQNSFSTDSQNFEELQDVNYLLEYVNTVLSNSARIFSSAFFVKEVNHPSYAATHGSHPLINNDILTLKDSSGNVLIRESLTTSGGAYPLSGADFDWSDPAVPALNVLLKIMENFYGVNKGVSAMTMLAEQSTINNLQKNDSITSRISSDTGVTIASKVQLASILQDFEIYAFPWEDGYRAVSGFQDTAVADFVKFLPAGKVVLIAGRPGNNIATVPNQGTNDPFHVNMFGSTFAKYRFAYAPDPRFHAFDQQAGSRDIFINTVLNGIYTFFGIIQSDPGVSARMMRTSRALKGACLTGAATRNVLNATVT